MTMIDKKNKEARYSFRLGNDLKELVDEFLEGNPDLTLSVLIRLALRKYLGGNDG